jgi:hypothetical protein
MAATVTGQLCRLAGMVPGKSLSLLWSPGELIHSYVHVQIGLRAQPLAQN